METLIFSLPFLYFIALLGMLSHFLKKKIKGENVTQITRYFKNHFSSTVLAFIATTVGFIAYVYAFPTEGVKDVLFIFGIGYTADSFFNKWDNEETKIGE